MRVDRSTPEERERVCVCVCVRARARMSVCVVGGMEGSWVIASTAVSSSGTDGRIAVMI